MQKHWYILLGILLLCTTPVTAAEHSTAEDDGDTIISIDIGKIVDVIDDLVNDFDSFTENWDEVLIEALKAALFQPFLLLLKFLVSIIASVLLHTPDVYPNPAVEEIHQQCLLITYLLSGLAFMFAGLLYMTGPILGVNYREVRLILPRIIIALVFATVSLPLLQYSVDLTNALVHAFQPAGLETSAGEIFGTSATLIIVWFVNSWLLLAVVVAFIVRSAYLLFVAAISPLLALAWSLPKAKRYADTFIAGWFTALAMAPLDMLVLKFMFTLMSGQGTNLIQTGSNWIYGVASAVLLLWVPFQLYGASQAAIGQAYAVSRGVKGRVKSYKQKKSRDQHREKMLRRQTRRNNQQRGGR